MSERRIKVMTMGDVWQGCYVAEPDEDYPLDSLVPEDHYLADEQDWQHVIKGPSGYVDLPTYVLAYHDGTPYTARYQSSALVWVLVEDGRYGFEPVVQDPDED